MKKNLQIPAALALLCPLVASGASFTSTGSGDWVAGGTWSGGPPNTGAVGSVGVDSVTIAGHDVTFNPATTPGGNSDWAVRGNQSVTIHSGGSLGQSAGGYWIRIGDNEAGTVTVNDGTFRVQNASALYSATRGADATFNIGDGVGAAESALLDTSGKTVNLSADIGGGGVGTTTINILSDGLFLGNGGIKRFAQHGVVNLNIDGGTYRAGSGNTEFGSQDVSSGTVTLTNGGSINQQSGDLHMGYNGDIDVVLHQNSSIQHDPGNWVWIARDSGTSTVTMNDTSTFTTNGRFEIGADQGGDNVATGTLTVNDLATVTSNAEVHLGKNSQGNGTITINDSGRVTAPIIYVGEAGSGTVNLEGGTLGANSIIVGGSGTFNWGAGTLTTREVSQNANNGSTDFSADGFSEVKLGTSISINTNLSTGFGGGSSTLDLNSFYINNGVRFDQLDVTGSLALAGPNDTLAIDINPYLLRPNIGLAIDSGSIPLITSTGPLTGIFENEPNFQQDVIGWSEFTGVFTDAASLPTNTYYLEYGTNTLFLHYKVEGTVPEPGTVGLLAIGLIFMRGMRNRLRRSA